MVFYPKIGDISPESMQGMSDDDVLYDLFLQQISSLGTEALSAEDVSFESFLSGKQLRNVNPKNKLIESAVLLRTGVPIEFVNNKRITFGNYLSKKEGSKNSILVRKTTGDTITIDVGQIISSWDSLADDNPPATPEEWASVSAGALEILGNGCHSTNKPSETRFDIFNHTLPKHRQYVPS